MRNLSCAVLAICWLWPTLTPGRAGEVPAPPRPPAVDVVAPAELPSANAPAWPPTVGEVTASPAAAEHRWYAAAEYLIWWLREGRIPAILTTGPDSSGGVLGAPGTRVLYGDERLETRHDDRFIGTRVTAGYWLTEDHALAVEGDAFFLERDSTYFKAVSAGDVLLARPYFDAVTGQGRSEIVAGPLPGGGRRNGGFNGYSRIELFGEQANLVIPAVTGEAFRLDVLAGAHFLQMRDRVDFTATGRLLPDQATLFGLTDHWRVDNRFFGGQAGLRGEYVRGRWSVSLRGEAALGGTYDVVRAFGDRLFQTPAQRDIVRYGLLVLPSNTGRFTRTDLTGVYETGANVGFRLTDHIRLFGGYTLLCWNNPIRAGDQADLVVNLRQVKGSPSGPAAPVIPFREDFFWAQGANVGLEFGW